MRRCCLKSKSHTAFQQTISPTKEIVALTENQEAFLAKNPFNMRCIPGCFGQLRRRNATMKRVQDQCLSEQHESVEFSPDKIESHKEEESACPTKHISQSEDDMDRSNEEKTVLDHSNENGKAEEMEKGKGDESGSSGEQDILINDKECAGVELKESSLQCSPVQEESAGSLFSLSIDSRKHHLAADMGDKEVSSAFKMKENAPLIKQSSDHHCKRRNGEMAVETSLSSWLVESEKSPQKMSPGSSPESEKNYEDRVILGVIDSS